MVYRKILEAYPNRIRELREAAGLTQQNLGDAAGLTKVQISRLELGDRGLGLKVMKKIAVALGVTISELINQEDISLKASNKPSDSSLPMSPSVVLLIRIADALERLAPPPREPADLSSHPIYQWDGRRVAAVAHFAPLPESLIVGVDRQKAGLTENSRRHAQGYAAHDVLLWGARGMGKSALVKSVTAGLQAEGLPLALVESSADQLASLPALFALLGKADRRFILFVDDMAFEGDDSGPRRLRSMLEGGAEARPDNVRLYVTSNRRNIVERNQADEDSAVNARDVADDRLALADRFGLKLGFQYPDQAAFLAMVAAYAGHFGLDCDEGDALAFAHGRGGRSGRIAWHYIVELAGRAGRNL